MRGDVVLLLLFDGCVLVVVLFVSVVLLVFFFLLCGLIGGLFTFPTRRSSVIVDATVCTRFCCVFFCYFLFSYVRRTFVCVILYVL